MIFLGGIFQRMLKQMVFCRAVTHCLNIDHSCMIRSKHNFTVLLHKGMTVVIALSFALHYGNKQVRAHALEEDGVGSQIVT